MILSAVIAGGTMVAANYGVKSDQPDTTAPKGYSTSNNASWSLKDLNIKGKELSLSFLKNACCGTKGGECPMKLVLSNGTGSDVWLHAEDSRLAMSREAKDVLGQWKPIEFRMRSDCGNSYHRVCLSAGRAWTWDVASSTGSMKTSTRFVLYLGDKRLMSPELITSLNPSIFELPDQLSGYQLNPDGVLVPH